jgi:hypothetical protein
VACSRKAGLTLAGSRFRKLTVEAKRFRVFIVFPGRVRTDELELRASEPERAAAHVWQQNNIR